MRISMTLTLYYALPVQCACLPASSLMINISDTDSQNESDDVRGAYKQHRDASKWRKFIRMEDVLLFRNTYELRKHTSVCVCVCSAALFKVFELKDKWYLKIKYAFSFENANLG